MTFFRRSVMQLSFVLALSLLSFAQSPSPRDYLLSNIPEAHASPDGKSAVFTVSTPDLATNHTQSIVMLLSLTSGKSSQLEGMPSDASLLRWSPDGRKLAFIGTLEGKKSVGVYDLSSKSVTRLCDYSLTNRFLSKSGNMLAWSPDGRQIALVGSLEQPASPTDPIVISATQYKTRTSLSDNRLAHIFLVNAADGEPKLLTSDNYDEHSIDWSPNGKEIVFVSNHEPDPGLRLNYDIFAVDIASGKQRQITHTPGVEYDPHVSPDGKWIAYVATKRPITTIDSVAEDAHVWVAPFAGGPGNELTQKLDRRCTSPSWSPDSHQIVLTASDHGNIGIFSVPVAGGDATARFLQEAQVQHYDLLPASNSFLAVVTNATSPAEVGTINATGHWSALSSVNSAATAKLQLIKPEHIIFNSFDGLPVEGWLYKPNSSAKTPMILSIHGGPHGAFGYFFDNHAQFFASRGYAVLVINPRGSSGYGQRFSDGTLNAWGAGDYKDLMAGVDHVLASHSNLDPNYLFVTGGSYGGFMTDWIITQTHRFRAAVSRADVSDLVSFYGTSLYHDLVEAEFSGFPWARNNYETLWRYSPVAHVADAVTPTLFLHGLSDNDVPYSQSEEMYIALRRKGIAAELALYPREGHGFNEPAHRLDELQRTLDWFEKYRK